MMIVIKRMNIDELLGSNDQEYTYFKRESPNKASKSETCNNTRESEEITGKPIKTDKIVINGKEYHGESIDKVLERARVLKSAIDKGIITDEEYTTAINDLANGLEQERQEKEIEDYYQTITNGLKTWVEKAGKSMQLIIDRMQDMHEELKEAEKEHPAETYKDVFLERFPDAKVEHGGTPCPCIIYIFGEKAKPINCGTCGCVYCWNREAKETYD